MPSLSNISKMNKDISIGCVVMASGLGRRFGGNKLMFPFAGKPMIQRTLESIQGQFSRSVVVTRYPEIRDLSRRMNIASILHDLPHRSDTIHLGLQYMADGLSGCMFCPGDQPLLTRESISNLTRAFIRDPEKIYRLGDGMPAIFPAWTFAGLLSLPEGSGGSAIMKKYPEMVRSVAPVHPHELLDADTPDMLHKLEKILLKQERAEVEYELPQGQIRK